MMDEPCTRQSLLRGNDDLWDIIMGQIKRNRRLERVLGFSVLLNAVLLVQRWNL